VSKKIWRLVTIMVIVAMLLSACGKKDEDPTAAPAEPTEQAAAPTTAPEAAPTAAPAAAGCPASTVADPMGLEGDYPYQFELVEFEGKADCELTFSENPEIAALNAELNGADASLPPVEDRLPSEPLVIQPYIEVGKYGGRLRGISKSPESGTSDFMSTRHVNMFRFSDDLLTIVPEGMGIQRRLYRANHLFARGPQMVGRRTIHRR